MARLEDIDKLSEDDLCQLLLEKQLNEHWEYPTSSRALKQLFNYPNNYPARSIPVN